MKLKAMLCFAAVASGIALTMPGTTVASTVSAPNELSITGTILGQGPTTVTGSQETAATTSTQIQNANIYDVLSNAVANVNTYGGGLTPTNLPMDGYIAFNPFGSDKNVSGTFYVTNSSGFYYPLSGYDANGNYYSYVELDTYNNDTNASLGAVNFGFSRNFSGVESEKYDSASGNGSATVTSGALFYVHDNPYAADAADSGEPFNTNGTALELRGNAVTLLDYSGGNVKTWSVALTGTGTYMHNGTNSVLNGDVSFSQGAPVTSSGGGGSGGGRSGGGRSGSGGGYRGI